MLTGFQMINLIEIIFAMPSMIPPTFRYTAHAIQTGLNDTVDGDKHYEDQVTTQNAGQASLVLRACLT